MKFCVAILLSCIAVVTLAMPMQKIDKRELKKSFGKAPASHHAIKFHHGAKLMDLEKFDHASKPAATKVQAKSHTKVEAHKPEHKAEVPHKIESHAPVHKAKPSHLTPKFEAHKPVKAVEPELENNSEDEMAIADYPAQDYPQADLDEDIDSVPKVSDDAEGSAFEEQANDAPVYDADAESDAEGDNVKAEADDAEDENAAPALEEDEESAEQNAEDNAEDGNDQSLEEEDEKNVEAEAEDAADAADADSEAENADAVDAEEQSDAEAKQNSEAEFEESADEPKQEELEESADETQAKQEFEESDEAKDEPEEDKSFFTKAAEAIFGTDNELEEESD